ncbi:MAG TPA: formate dehydrogenase [Burkholderiaceae bacterium]
MATPRTEVNPPAATPLKRRGVLLGAAAAAGAAVVAAKVVPAGAPEPVAAAPAKPEGEAGYRLTAHVKRYYETART